MNIFKKISIIAVLASSSVANAGIINGGELLGQTGANFLEGQLGLGDLDFTNISNLSSGASSTTWHADVAGKTNVISIYDITYQGTNYLVGGYSVIGHDGNGYSNTTLTENNFLFNLSLGSVHTEQDIPWATNLYDQYDSSSYFATFGGGHDLYGGNTTLGSGNGYANGGGALYNYGYSYGGSANLVSGLTTTGLEYFAVNGLESFTFAAAAVPEPSIITLFGLGLLGLGFARRRKAQS